MLRGFAAAATACAVGVVTARNPVHAVLALVRVFVNATALRLLLRVEFRALIFLVVYVGAIAVLFLFVVRRLNVQPTSESSRRPRARLRVAVVWAELAAVRVSTLPGEVEETLRLTEWVDYRDHLTSVQVLGQVLYTHLFLYFLRAGFVLLVARIGAIVLTLSADGAARVPTRRQQVHQQLSRDADRALFRVKTGSAVKRRATNH